MTLGLVLGSLTGLVAMSTPAAAADGNILPPFSTGETWSVCEGYNHGTHTGTSAYGLDLVKNGSGSCDNSSAGATVKAPLGGTVYYYQASYGNLCVNIAGGRSYTLTHITSSITSGSVTAGQTVGSVGSAGMYNNNGVAHIHFQMWSAPGCYNSSVMPFDTADGARICGAPNMTSSGPSGGNGTWSGTSFTGQNCGSTPQLPLRSSVSATQNADGKIEVVGISPTGGLRGNRQVQVNGGFYTSWYDLPSYAKDVTAVSNADGRIELLYIGGDGAVWGRSQPTPNGAFGGEYTLGGSLTSAISAAKNADGRIQIFAVGTDGSIYTKRQVTPNGVFEAGWTKITAFAEDVAAATNADGRIELLYIGGDGAVWGRAQTAPNSSSFGSEYTLGGWLSPSLSVVADNAGKLEVFAIGTDSHIYRKMQTAPNGTFESTWQNIPAQAKDVSAVKEVDGRIEILYVGANSAMWGRTEATNGTLGNEYTLLGSFQ